MQILPVSLNNNNSFGFKAKLMPQQSVGVLKRTTSYNMEGILHAYREIMTKLNSKTEEGLNFIRINFPNVTIGEGLTFHNCGPDKTSILIRCAEDQMYMGLTRIIVREGRTFEASRRVKDSFMIYNYDRAVTNFDERHSKQFPNKSILATPEELDKSNYDERLNAVLKNLDEAMLPFRIFLSKNMNSYLKKPDGKLEENIKEKLRLVDILYREINTISDKLSHKTLFEFKKDFGSYVLLSGLKTHDFKDLGPEKLTIHCAKVETTKHCNLKRLMVTDKDGFHVAGFLIKDNDKIVKNVNPKTLIIPDKLTYLNEEEMAAPELISDFEKYLNLYLQRLNAYKTSLVYITRPRKSKPSLELSVQSQKNFKDGLESLGIILQMLKSEGKKKDYSRLLKENSVNYISTTKGITFTDYKNNMRIHVLPIKSSKHSGLMRITISKQDFSDEKVYLIKDFKHIVKNFNPKFPLTIPKVLSYIEAEEADAEMLTPCSEYILNKLNGILKLLSDADKFAEIQPVKKERLPKPIKTGDDIRDNLVKECFKEFKYAMKNIDSSLGEFLITMRKINEKVTKYYNEHHK